MSNRFKGWMVALTLIGGLGLAGALYALPQHEAHHPEQAQTGEEATPPTCPMMGEQMAMMQEMMGQMAARMGTMRQMMGGMGGPQGETMQGGAGMMGYGAMMGGMMDQMMGGMMSGMMAQSDPAAIDDPAVADQRAEQLEAMVERMRDHIEQLEARIGALRERAAALRGGS